MFIQQPDHADHVGYRVHLAPAGVDLGQRLLVRHTLQRGIAEIEGILQAAQLKERMAKAQSSQIIVSVFGEYFAIQLFGAFKVAGAQRLVGAVAECVASIAGSSRCSRASPVQAPYSEMIEPWLLPTGHHRRATRALAMADGQGFMVRKT